MTYRTIAERRARINSARIWLARVFFLAALVVFFWKVL